MISVSYFWWCHLLGFVDAKSGPWCITCLSTSSDNILLRHHLRLRFRHWQENLPLRELRAGKKPKLCPRDTKLHKLFEKYGATAKRTMTKLQILTSSLFLTKFFAIIHNVCLHYLTSVIQEGWLSPAERASVSAISLPGYAPGTIAVNLTWMERGFNAGQTHRSMYPSIFNRLRAIARYWSEIANFSYHPCI